MKQLGVLLAALLLLLDGMLVHHRVPNMKQLRVQRRVEKGMLSKETTQVVRVEPPIN